MTLPRFPFLKLLCAGLAAGSFWAVSPLAHAVVIAQYNFEASDPAHLNPSTIGSGATATSISRNTLNTLGDNPGFVRSSNNPPSGSFSLAITFANIDDSFAQAGGAPSTDNITFTIGATAGQSLNLDTLTFMAALNTEETPSNKGMILTVQYDDLSDGAGFQLLPQNVPADTIIFDNLAVTRTVDLSAAAFDNLTAGITFRINFSESGGPSTGNSGRIDLITVNGAVVPEPSAALILFFGFSLLGLHRRR